MNPTPAPFFSGVCLKQPWGSAQWDSASCHRYHHSVSIEEVRNSTLPHIFRIPTCLLFCTMDCLKQRLCGFDLVSLIEYELSQAACPFSFLVCSVILFIQWLFSGKLWQEVSSSLGATGLRFSHTGSYPWARDGMKGSLCCGTGTGCHASTPQLDIPLGCYQAHADTRTQLKELHKLIVRFIFSRKVKLPAGT